MLFCLNSVEEDEIEEQCDKLRKKLLAEMEKNGGRNALPKKGLKSHQVHELAEGEDKRERAATASAQDQQRL